MKKDYTTAEERENLDGQELALINIRRHNEALRIEIELKKKRIEEPLRTLDNLYDDGTISMSEWKILVAPIQAEVNRLLAELDQGLDTAYDCAQSIAASDPTGQDLDRFYGDH
tara:strand:- start:393 stop:731 length:339 start_codon:yes stop_codon:yes gene_type:complete